MELDGVQVAHRLRGRQARLLLVYLLLNRRRLISRQELINALWPAATPVSAHAALRTLLSRVRSALAPGTVTGRDEVMLSLEEPVWIDLEAAAVELQRAVLALERGDPRTAWAVAQVPLNIAGRGLVPGLQASWLEAPRAELDDIRLQALEVVGGAGLALGGAQLASVERAGRSLVDADPYRESGYLLLMQAAARRGNPAAAMRVFEQLRQLMREELGTSPSGEAIAVYERVLSPGAAEPLRLTEGQSASSATVALPTEVQAGCPGELVGRQHELGELLRLWAQASKSDMVGVARVAALAGETGIGKTCLAGKLAEQAHAEGSVVLLGRAPEEGLAPYQAFLDALHHYFATADLDELAGAVRDYGPELAGLIPEIRRRIPDLAPAPSGAPAAERYRLFEAVVGLLGALSERAPILLLLDDLHWADRGTLLLLRHLARAPRVSRLLIVVSFRAEAEADGLRHLMAELARDGLSRQLEIAGLDLDETAELVRLHTGENPSRPLVQALHRATEGNPLFIEEIVRSLTRAGIDLSTAHASALSELSLPEGVKRMIADRMDLLDAGTVHCLRVASVIGRDFDVAMLEEVAGLSEEELLQALEEALGAGVVMESHAEPGRYSFAHAPIRAALYEGMSAARRMRIHRHVGEALEAGGHAEVRELARHYALAAGREEAGKAIRYSVHAGQRATGALAHEEAAEHYARALAVLKRFGPDDDAQRLELLLLLGEARVRAGERALVLGVMQEAAELAEKLGNTRGLVRAATGASRRYVQQPGVVESEVIALLHRALERTAGEMSADRVLLLSRTCGALYYSPQRDRLPDLSAEALRIADRLADDPGTRAHAFAARRRALWDAAHLKERLESSTRMLDCASQTADLELQLQARAFLVVDLLESGDRGAADDQIKRFTEVAERLFQPLYQWNATVWEGMLALLDGRLDRAEAAAGEALATGAPAEVVTAPLYYEAQRWVIKREQGYLADVEPSVRRRVEAHPERPGWRAVLAMLLMERGRTEEASQELRRLAGEDFANLPPDGDWLTSVVLVAELSAGLGDLDRAARAYELLLPHAGVNIVAGQGVLCLGSAARYIGKLASALGRHEEASRHFERALEANMKLRAPMWVAHTQLDYAEALGTGRRAARLIEDAASVAQELELPAIRRRAERLRDALRPSPA